MGEDMLEVKIKSSRLRADLKWDVAAALSSATCHHIQGRNGLGKSTFLDELKAHWKDFFPALPLGFVDQGPLSSFEGLQVRTLVDTMWDVERERRLENDWRSLSCWQTSFARSLIGKPVARLSGGEAQWVKLLMMRSLRASVWMLDEPFQSLDHERQSELWKLLAQELAAGRTLLLVHHGPVALSPLAEWTLTCGATGVRLEKL